MTINELLVQSSAAYMHGTWSVHTCRALRVGDRSRAPWIVIQYPWPRPCLASRSRFGPRPLASERP